MNGPHSTAGAGSAGGRHRVLLVDDEESILRALERLLRREPYEVVATASPRDAVRMLEEQPAGLVVSEQRMMEMAGADFLQQVRQRWPETIRIILSGYPDASAARDAVNSGAGYKYLTKPWDDEEIKLEIRRALEQYDLAVEDRRLAAGVDQRANDAAAGLSSCRPGPESRRGAEAALSEELE